MAKELRNIVITLIAAFLVSGCAESEFHLASESRLPIWFEVPNGMERNDLDIVLTYYTIGPAKLRLRDFQKGITLKTIKAENKWHPEYSKWSKKDWPKRSHPSYQILEFDGMREIIEHKRMEPIFYVSDESTVQSIITGSETHNKSLKNGTREELRAP